MERNSYQAWTSDRVIGAAIVTIGVVAALVRLHILVMQWSAAPSPIVVHLWPLLLIGAGILLLFEHEEQPVMPRRHSLNRGERQ